MALLSARDLGLPDVAPCPFCGGSETELLAGFGSQLSVATYWCRRCRSAFDNFKAPPESLTRKKVPGAEK